MKLYYTNVLRQLKNGESLSWPKEHRTVLLLIVEYEFKKLKTPEQFSI